MAPMAPTASRNSWGGPHNYHAFGIYRTYGGYRKLGGGPKNYRAYGVSRNFLGDPLNYCAYVSMTTMAPTGLANPNPNPNPNPSPILNKPRNILSLKLQVKG